VPVGPPLDPVVGRYINLCLGQLRERGRGQSPQPHPEPSTRSQARPPRWNPFRSLWPLHRGWSPAAHLSPVSSPPPGQRGPLPLRQLPTPESLPPEALPSQLLPKLCTAWKTRKGMALTRGGRTGKSQVERIFPSHLYTDPGQL
jgi:hypothetical protein